MGDAARQRTIRPEGWPRPQGYADAVLAEGRSLFIAGQVGWRPDGVFETDDFAGQAAQALSNIAAILAAAGGGPEHLTRLTWFVTDRQAYLDAQKEIGAAYREIIGRHFPAMSVVEVKGLLEPRARVEIEATAVLP